jgi:3-keto-5-aminohexanoate cleavage enzyme
VGCGLAELAIRRGGHVRVGLQDFAGPGEPSNLDPLSAPATAAQARRILGVPLSRRRV